MDSNEHDLAQEVLEQLRTRDVFDHPIDTQCGDVLEIVLVEGKQHCRLAFYKSELNQWELHSFWDFVGDEGDQYDAGCVATSFGARPKAGERDSNGYS